MLSSHPASRGSARGKSQFLASPQSGALIVRSGSPIVQSASLIVFTPNVEEVVKEKNRLNCLSRGFEETRLVQAELECGFIRIEMLAERKRDREREREICRDRETERHRDRETERFSQ